MSTRSRGRHFAPPAPRRRRNVRHASSSAATSALPLSIGLGLAVTMVTTGFTVASGSPATLLDGAPDGAEPVVGALGSGPAPEARAESRPEAPVAAVVADGGAAAEVAASRDGAASRSGVRAAPATADVVVAADATLTAEKLRVDVTAAPDPVLPGCDGEASGAGTNGNVPLSEMCVLWDGGPAIRADAAVALAKLNQEFRATFGEDMCITDGYRSYSQQVATKAAKGYLAAMPGTSNHGWGLAVDLCPDTYAGDRWRWLAAHAPAYGWDNPPWARPSGSKYEPWHWEFTAAVEVANAR